MPDKISYYAIIDELSSRDEPGGVLRRIDNGNLTIDQAFSGELDWFATPILYEAEHGDTMFDFAKISEAEAEQIVARIRAQAASGG